MMRVARLNISVLAVVLGLITVAGCSSEESGSTSTPRTEETSSPSSTNPNQTTTTPYALPTEDRRVLELTGEDLTIADVVDIAEGRANIEVSDAGMERVQKARAVVDHYIDEGLRSICSCRRQL
jgi:ABC-type oligopeptide transport system substrate-binding subunit